VTTAAWYMIPSRNIAARWVNVLDLPYTAWHLSYAALGAGLAARLDWALLGWTVLAFFLGMGVAAHCFDLVRGDPLRLRLNPGHLYLVGGLTLGAAAIIGFWQWLAGNVPFWLWVAIPTGVILAAGYNLEWPGLHGDWQFAAWWSVFPFLVGYFAQGVAFHPALVPLAAFAFLTAYAQRVLSTRVRYLRRKVRTATVSLETWHEGQREWLFGRMESKAWLLEADEKALAWMSAAMVVLAGAVLTFHLL
jgi:hypothetical protein